MLLFGHLKQDNLGGVGERRPSAIRYYNKYQRLDSSKDTNA